MITKTIGEILEETTKKFPTSEAVVYPKKIRLSYEQFNQKIDQLAKALLAIGINKGDKIGIWANNIPEWIFLQFASAKIGAIIVTINTYSKCRELDYYLKRADIKALFFINTFKDVDYIETIHTLLTTYVKKQPVSHPSYPYLKYLIALSEKTSSEFITFNDLLKKYPNTTDEQLTNQQKKLDPYDVINMQFTSGTTGYPKIVMLTHYNIINNAHDVGKKMDIQHHDRMCIPVPFFHCFGCVLSVLNCVIHGATMLPVETFNPGKVLQLIQNEKCTILQGVPTMFISYLNYPTFSTFDLHSLRSGIMAGAPCPVEIMQQVLKKMHLQELTICYGLTETSPVLTQTDRSDPIEKRVETVGKPLPHIDIRIVDPKTGQELPPNTPGELIARGYNVMKGYYKMPKHTAQTIKNGWIYTKDLALQDLEGYIKILGRIDDMIIRGGENVYPREIEEFLYTNEKIREVAIIGVPSEKYGEEVFAFVQLKDGVTALKEEIQEFCKDKISRFKIPKYIEFINAYPMTESGKIQKYRLRQLAEQKINNQF